MNKPKSVKTLEKLGRERLSESFFMRDFLYSEISQIEGIPNIPDFPDIAIEAGKNLCEKVLEPIRENLGHISIRSAYRSCAVNAKGAENNNQYKCARNEANFAGHIWDYRDSDGFMGATACIIVNSFIPYYERTKHWQALAWWIHDNIDGYSSMEFFKKFAAFNITWHEKPKKYISNYIDSPRCLTKPGMENHLISHAEEYKEFIDKIKT